MLAVLLLAVGMLKVLMSELLEVCSKNVSRFIFGTASIHLHDICSSQEKQAFISLVNRYMSVRPDYISFSSLFSLMAAYIVQKNSHSRAVGHEFFLLMVIVNS